MATQGGQRGSGSNPSQTNQGVSGQQMLQGLQNIGMGIFQTGAAAVGALGLGGLQGLNNTSGAGSSVKGDAGIDATSTEDGTGVKVKNVNPPLTPDQIIGLYNTPIQQPALPTLKLQDIRVPNIKNRTLQSHLKAIEAKMIMTEKLMRDIVKFQKYQIITERQLNERKRELYQNTFEEYLLDKTVSFEDEDKKNKDCICINLPNLAAAAPVVGAPGLPTPTPPLPPPPPDQPSAPQTRTRTPISQPSIPSAEPPPFIMRQAQRTDSLIQMASLIPGGGKVLQVLKQTAGVAGAAGLTQAWAKAWYQHYMDEERKYIGQKIKDILKLMGNERVGELNNIKIIKQRAASFIQTPQAQKGSYTPSKYWREAHPTAAAGRKLEEFFQSAQGGSVEMHQFVAQSDYNITSNILNGFGTDYGEIRTPFTEEIIKQGKYDPKDTRSEGRVLDKKGEERLQQLDPGMPARPSPAAPATPPVNFASGGIPGGDLELYNSQSQNYFRNLSSDITNQINSSSVIQNHAGGGWLSPLSKIISKVTNPFAKPKTLSTKGVRAGFTGMAKQGFDAIMGGDKFKLGKWKPQLLGRGAYNAPTVKGAQRYAGSAGSMGGSQTPGGVVKTIVPRGAARSSLIDIIEPQSKVKPATFDKGKLLADRLLSGEWKNSALANKLRDQLITGEAVKPMTKISGLGRGQSLLKLLSGTARLGGKALGAVGPLLDLAFPDAVGQYDQITGPNAYYNAPGYKGPRPKASGGILGGLDNIGRGLFQNVGGTVGRNKGKDTGIPGGGTIGEIMGRNRGRDIYEKITEPVRDFKNPLRSSSSSNLENVQTNLSNSTTNTPTVIPLPPDYIKIPMPSSNKKTESDTFLQPPGIEQWSSIFSMESGSY